MATDGAAEMARLSADLTLASVTVAAKAGTAMGKALGDIQAGAQNRSPVDTGALRNSVTSELQRNGGTLRGEVGPTVNYGAYVELGTSRMRAQPYLRPATDAVIPGYEAALGQITGDIL